MFILEDIEVQFGVTPALTIDSLTLSAGESVALLGSNGSGKSTLINLLAGNSKATRGSITSTQPAIALVAQHQKQHHLLPISVEQVVKIGCYRQLGLLGRFSSPYRKRVAEAMELLQVSHLAKERFNTLSGGQRQRVVIASAIASKPDCLLLDEPTTGLDIPSREVIMALITELSGQGALVVVATHRLDVVEQCSRTLLLKNKILADGPAQSVTQADILAEAFGPLPIDVVTPCH